MSELSIHGTSSLQDPVARYDEYYRAQPYEYVETAESRQQIIIAQVSPHNSKRTVISTLRTIPNSVFQPPASTES
jgi:hypothetical protein